MFLSLSLSLSLSTEVSAETDQPRLDLCRSFELNQLPRNDVQETRHLNDATRLKPEWNDDGASDADWVAITADFVPAIQLVVKC